MPQLTVPALSPELYWLTLTAVLTAVMWVPYIIQLIAQMGVFTAFFDRFHETAHTARWAQRAKRAHHNAVENLVVFSALVLTLSISGFGNSLTALACQIYFYVRAAHYVVYVLAFPVIRTLLFLAGVACQMVIAGTLLGLIS
jgi:uncharacterized MAPEG superfamily protein